MDSIEELQIQMELTKIAFNGISETLIMQDYINKSTQKLFDEVAIMLDCITQRLTALERQSLLYTIDTNLLNNC